MNWNKVDVYTTTQGVDFISGILLQNGVNGFMVEDAADFQEFLQDTTIHWDYVEEDLMKLSQCETKVTFYLPDAVEGLETYRQVKEMTARLPQINPEVDFGRLCFETEIVDEEDWSTAWKKYYHTLKIGNRLVVSPCWETYVPAEGEAVIRLDPGMAFGTGTHASTKLCMELLEGHARNGKTVLDVGCGSGILAITALVLGADRAVGVDIDPVAVKVAVENAQLNGVDDRLTTMCGNLTEKVEGKYDIICANIVADVIIALCPDIPAYLEKDGVFITSGIIAERRDEVVEAIKGQGLKVRQIREEGGWAAIEAGF